MSTIEQPSQQFRVQHALVQEIDYGTPRALADKRQYAGDGLTFLVPVAERLRPARLRLLTAARDRKRAGLDRLRDHRARFPGRPEPLSECRCDQRATLFGAEYEMEIRADVRHASIQPSLRDLRHSICQR